MKRVFQLLNEMVREYHQAAFVRKTVGGVSELDCDEAAERISRSHGVLRIKEELRKVEAKRPISEKIAAVKRLREFERSLADVRKANKRKRAAKQIRINIKTR